MEIFNNKEIRTVRDKENETVTNCNALKLKTQEGKYRLTDV